MTAKEQIKAAAKLRYHRLESGMTLEQVAERIGVSNGAVSHWESGRYLPSSNHVDAINELFGNKELEELAERMNCSTQTVIEVAVRFLKGTIEGKSLPGKLDVALVEEKPVEQIEVKKPVNKKKRLRRGESDHMTWLRLRALRAIASLKTATLKELAEVLHIHYNTTWKCMDALELSDYVSVNRIRKTNSYSLTEKGKATIEEYRGQ